MNSGILSFLVFSFSKLVVFSSPLIVLSLLGSESYVLTEQAISLALLLIPLLNAGMTPAYAYYVIEKKDIGFKHNFYRHLLICIFILLLARFIPTGQFESGGVYGVFISMAMFLLFFGFLSITYKCKNDVKRSSALDACPYILIFVFIILNYILPIYAEVFVLSLGVIFAFITVKVINSNKSFLPRSIFDFSGTLSYYKKGFRCFIVSWLAIAVVVVPRSFIPEILTVEDAENVYLCMRAAAVLVFGFQFLQISFFTKLFGLSRSGLNILWCSFWMAGSVIFFVALLFVESEFISWAYLYTLLWISVAFLELQVNRKSKEWNVFFLSFFIIPLLLLFFYIRSFFDFSLLSLFLLLFYVGVQLRWVTDLRLGLSLLIFPIVNSLLYWVFYA